MDQKELDKFVQEHCDFLPKNKNSNTDSENYQWYIKNRLEPCPDCGDMVKTRTIQIKKFTMLSQAKFCKECKRYLHPKVLIK